MSSSLPPPTSHSPGTETEARDISNALLLSILRSLETNRTGLEDRNNSIGITESTMQFRSMSSEQPNTEFLDSPEGLELLAVDDMLNSSIDAPSSQLCPPRMSLTPLRQISVTSNSEFEAEDTAVRSSGVIEFKHDIEKRTNGKTPSSFSTRDLCFRSPSPFPTFSPAPSFHPFSQGTSSEETDIQQRRKKSNAKINKKRKRSKNRLIDSDPFYSTRGSRNNNKLSKQKGKLHHGRALKSRRNENTEKTRDDNRFVEDSADTDDVVANSNSEAPTGGGSLLLTFIKNAFLAKVKQNWDEVIGLYLDGKFEEIKHRQIKTMNFSKAYSEFKFKLEPDGDIVNLRIIARAHIRNLMFSNARNVSRYAQVPWSKLGLWLYFRKKRFINWDKSIPFAEFRSRPCLISYLRVQQLKSMLLIDLVDWTEDEIKSGTVEVPLVLDPRGQVLVKVADLPRLYDFVRIDSDEPVLRDEESISGSQYETQSSSSTSSSSNSDGDSDSDSESGTEEDSESDYTRKMVKSRMKKKLKRSD